MDAVRARGMVGSRHHRRTARRFDGGGDLGLAAGDVHRTDVGLLGAPQDMDDHWRSCAVDGGERLSRQAPCRHAGGNDNDRMGGESHHSSARRAHLSYTGCAVSGEAANLPAHETPLCRSLRMSAFEFNKFAGAFLGTVILIVVLNLVGKRAVCAARARAARHRRQRAGGTGCDRGGRRDAAARRSPGCRRRREGQEGREKVRLVPHLRAGRQEQDRPQPVGYPWRSAGARRGLQVLLGHGRCRRGLGLRRARRLFSPTPRPRSRALR